MSSDKENDDCVVLSKGAFDPDAVFMDDIVDDDVLPNANLAVDGLTSVWQARRGRLELRSDEPAANDLNETIEPNTKIPVIMTAPQGLEVYGFEPSFWKKLRGYIGF
jgi:hypothetical protein